MNSDRADIVFLADKHFFLKTTSYIENNSKEYRKIKLEGQIRKAIMKFSKHDTHCLTNYLTEEQNEMMA